VAIVEQLAAANALSFPLQSPSMQQQKEGWMEKGDFSKERGVSLGLCWSVVSAGNCAAGKGKKGHNEIGEGT
jgi:hypothetical protein